MTLTVWRVLAIVAVIAPSRLSGPLDGAPLEQLGEALLLGLIAPTLAWLHPQFLRRAAARGLVAAILILKLAGVVFLQQEGWCVSFVPPRPMVRDSTGKPHSWDIRADWLADDPRCSAMMTRSYRDSFEVPAWFFNLPPPDDAVVRTGFEPGIMPVEINGSGYLTVRDAGTFELFSTEPMTMRLRVNGVQVEPIAPAHHQLRLERGSHLVQFSGVLLSKTWRVVPQWEGRPLGSIDFPIATALPPSSLDRVARPLLNVMLSLLIAVLAALWAASAMRSLRSRHLLAWSAAAGLGVAAVATSAPSQAAWYTAAIATVTLLIAVPRHAMNAYGVFVLVGVPWLIYIAAITAHTAGRWTLYGIGNDNFQFQRFSYRVFMQHYWLEGGQPTFWNQPLYRWIAGALHMIFGDSSVGQAYLDAAFVVVIMLFAYRVVAQRAGFASGLFAALLPMWMFLLGPAQEFVGFGLSEISSAGFIYLAALLALSARRFATLAAIATLVMLGFYTRLNNLPLAVAVAAFALPLTITAADLWRPRLWIAGARWRVAGAVAIGLSLAAVLFAWRTWYYTDVFSVFHGTQRDYLAVWKPGMTWPQALAAMGSSLMMVLTGQDPPRFSWHAVPLLAASIIAVAGVIGIRLFRNIPAALIIFFAAGASGALVTRGWGYEGRFSIHLYGAASALCVCAAAAAVRAARDRIQSLRKQEREMIRGRQST